MSVCEVGSESAGTIGGPEGGGASPAASQETPQTPAGSPEMRVALVVLNAASGDQADRGAVAALVERTLREHGWSVEIEHVEPSALEEAVARACLRSKELAGSIVVVGGGDGTIRTAASLAVRHGVLLGMLPMGTMNLLPRDLGLPLDVERAAGAIATGRERRVDAGMVNGRLFLHSSVLGVVPLLGKQRERFRRSRTWGERWGALARAARQVFATPRLTLWIEHDGRVERVRTHALAVSNNPLSVQPGRAFLRESIDGGRLGIYTAQHRGGLGIISLLFTMGLGRWALDRQVEVSETTRLRITAPRPSLAVSNDGEVERLELPLNYSMRRLGLRVLVPIETGGHDADGAGDAGAGGAGAGGRGTGA